MRFLVDTHVWLWLLESPGKLSQPVRGALEQAEDLVLSVASVWELAIKAKLGKIELPSTVGAARDEFLSQAAARELAIQSSHALAAADLPPLHRDPFDRLLIAQSQIERSSLSASATRPSYTARSPAIAVGRSST